MTPSKILAAIDAAFASSPVPPTSGDLAAAVLRALAEDPGSWTDEDLLELADQLDGRIYDVMPPNCQRHFRVINNQSEAAND